MRNGRFVSLTLTTIVVVVARPMMISRIGRWRRSARKSTATIAIVFVYSSRSRDLTGARDPDR